MVLGLLLGCIRHGEPMPSDADADFGFLDEDLNAFLQAIDVLEEKGFRLYPVSVNNDGTDSKWPFWFQGVKYEFFLFHRIGNRLRWYYHKRKPPTEIVNEIDVHELAEIELYGRRWLKPDNHERYLRALYGDWRTPDPYYRYWKDCRASISRHPWTGVRKRTLRS